MKTDINTIIKREFGDRIFFTEERTFGGVVVFLHSGIGTFLKLIDSVFERSPVQKFQVNLGMNMCGACKFDKSRVYLVWVNSDLRPDPIGTIGPFVHEISHMVDIMVEKAGVADSAGETKAYLVERYTEFVLYKMGLSDGASLDEFKTGNLMSNICMDLANGNKNKNKDGNK